MLVFWALTALTVTWWPLADPLALAGRRLQPPSWQNWLGTDALGRDVFSRTLHGATWSIPISVAVVAAAVTIGSTLGALAGFFGGWIDTLVMRTVDVTLSFPPILLAMTVAATLGPGLANASVAMIIVWWPIYARLMRAQVLEVKTREHVEAAVAGGAGRMRVLRVHVLPLCWTPTLVNATMDFGQVVLLAASLSFIGLGALPPAPEWGAMISEGAAKFYQWWIAAGPGLAILSGGAGDLVPRRWPARSLRPQGGAMTCLSRSGSIRAGGTRAEDVSLDAAGIVAGSAMPDMTALLAIDNLTAAFPGPGGWSDAIRGVSLSVEAGEVLGIVGESGSGKSLTMMALLQLLPPGTRVSGSARFRGAELIGMAPSAIRRLRGKDIGCIFQDPLSAFNPVVTIGDQIAEAIRLHHNVSRRAALARAADLLDLVSIPQPARRLGQYPYEFSGGMRQRAMIAMALANDPALLIADEPTTALDVTVQAQILELLQRLRADLGLAVVLITHDLGVVAGMADRIAVMYGGRIVEDGSAEAVFYDTRHPYTRGLIAAVPTLDRAIDTLVPIEGTPPSIHARPPGCAFHPRCPEATAICRVEDPALRPVGATRCACHHADNLPARRERHA